MKPACIIALLCTTLALSAEWGIRLDLNGMGNQIPLDPAPGGRYIQNIQWGDAAKRPFALFVQKKGIPDNATETLEVSFIPRKSGNVVLWLSGCYVKSPKAAEPDRAFVEYRLIEAKGTTIQNGDFSRRNAGGAPEAWTLRNGAFATASGVQAWQNGSACQTIRVQADQPVTLRIQAVKGRYEKAKPPAPPLVFRHNGWTMKIDPASGAWLALDFREKPILRNPKGLNSFQLTLTDFPGSRRLSSHVFSPQTGELTLRWDLPVWQVTERIVLGKRLCRTLEFVNTGKRTQKLTNALLYHYFPPRGRYYFPALFFGDNRGYQAVARDFEFESHRTGALADLKKSTVLRGAFDGYFLFLEPFPGTTVMLAFDGRTDMNRTDLQSLGETIRATTFSASTGWIFPNVPQKVGPHYLEVVDAPLKTAMRNAPAAWFHDIGMLPPADRPDWVRDVTLYVTLPAPKLGSVASAADGAPLLRRIAALGYNTLWLLPPYYSDALYLPTDFYRLRPEVGTFAEYRAFVKAAKRARLRVWQDLIPHGGLAKTAAKRGLSPWTLAVEPDGRIRRSEAYDYGSREWRNYMCNVAKYYMEQTEIDGFRLDQCGFSRRNWRNPETFRREDQPHVDRQWLKAELEKTGGKVPMPEISRASDDDRQTGPRLTREIRDVVRSIRPDGALLAEIASLNTVPAGDAIFDFHFRRFLLLLERFGGENSAREIALFLQEQKDTAPPGTLFERFLEIHDAFSVQSTSWVGEGAGQAARAMMFLAQGMPSILHGASDGRGTLLARLNKVRTALPELRRGTVDYLAVASRPAVFTALHTMPGAESVAAVSFLPTARDVRLTLPASTAFRPDTEVELYENMAGRSIARGKISELRQLSCRLEPYGIAVFSFRPAGAGGPTPPEPALPTPEVPEEQPEIIRQNGTVTVTGSWPLVIDESSGRLLQFGPYIGEARRFGDSPDRSHATGVSVRREGSSVVVTAKMDDGGSLQYTLDGNELSIAAELRKYRPEERSALLLPVKNISRWQVFTAEGLMDDRFDPAAISERFHGSLPYLSWSHRQFLSPVLWQSTAKPLDWNRPVLRFFGTDGGVEIIVPEPLSRNYDDLMLLSHLSAEEKTPHVAAFWVQPGPLSLADGKNPRRVELRIRPAKGQLPQHQVVRTPAVVQHESTLWRISNPHFEAEIRRNGGGIRRMLTHDGTVVAENQDVRLYDGGKPSAAGRASFDPETTARYFLRDGKQFLRFAALLRTAENNGIPTPPVWLVTEYEFGTGKELLQKNFLYATSGVIGEGNFALKRVKNPRVFYQVKEAAGEKKIPMLLTPRRYSVLAMNYSATERGSAPAPEPPAIRILPPGYQLSGWITGDSRRRLLLIGEQLPGNLQINWASQNFQLLPGHRTPAAVKVQVPGFVNLGEERHLAPGRYRLKSRFRTENIIRKGGRFWLELRLEYEQNGTMKLMKKRIEIPEGSHDYQEVSADFELPVGSETFTRAVLALAIDGEGDGAVTADTLELETLRQDAGIPEVTEELLQRAVVSFGNRERLNRFFEKAERGESLTVGVLGGSITQGAACPDPAQRYHGVLLRYLQQEFPNSKFRLVNAGIGATASDYGALRAQRDLLSARPDLIVLEFGVNDKPTIEYARTYEGILRQILTEKEKPALILLFMMWNTRKNAQEFQQKLGEHYQLPMVSYRDALAPALESGLLRWEQLSPDWVHPRPAAHTFAGKLLTGMLEKARRMGKSEAEAPLPAPLYSDRFEHCFLREGKELAPVRNNGWSLVGRKGKNPAGWSASTPGSTLELEFEGTGLMVSWWCIKAPMGKISVQVDDRPARTFDGYFKESWGGKRFWAQVAENLPAGKHRARITLLSERNPASSGTEFLLLGIGGTR